MKICTIYTNSYFTKEKKNRKIVMRREIAMNGEENYVGWFYEGPPNKKL